MGYQRQGSTVLHTYFLGVTARNEAKTISFDRPWEELTDDVKAATQAHCKEMQIVSRERGIGPDGGAPDLPIPVDSAWLPPVRG